MTEDFTSEALYYLMGELEPARGAQFERRLAADPVAAAAFKTCVDSLAEFALQLPPQAPLDAQERREILAAVLAATGADAGPKNPGWRTYLWPVAAAALLALNIAQWALHRTASPAPAARGPSPIAKPAAAAEDKGGASRALQDEADRLAALRQERIRLLEDRDALRAEYKHLLQEVAIQAATEQGAGRIVAMELVDPGSYSRGDRKGLFELAATLLATPGVIAAAPARAPVAPGGSSPPVAPGAPLPYAWSVFDEALHEGHIDLYDLPQVPADQSLQLWVQPAGSDAYVRAGEIPAQLYGQSGGVSYKLPSETMVPAQILVTVEPLGSQPTAPGSAVVLHGP